MIIAFTGHRPSSLGGYTIPNDTYNKVITKIESLLVELKPELVVCGMALGVDQWAAEICIKLGIPFIAAVPFIGQESIWPPESKDKYKELLAKASEVEIVSEGGYTPAKLQIRNCWMVDRSDLIIAVFNGSSGGTANCIKYAKQQEKQIIIINPNE